MPDYLVSRKALYPSRPLRNGRGLAEYVFDPSEGRGTMLVSQITIDTDTAEGPFHVHALVDNIYFVLEGNLDVAVADTAFRLEVGDGIFIPAGVAHGTRNPGRTQAVVMGIYNGPIDDDFQVEEGRVGDYSSLEEA